MPVTGNRQEYTRSVHVSSDHLVARERGQDRALIDGVKRITNSTGGM